MPSDIYAVKECPDCASMDIIYNDRRQQVICKSCGLIYEPLTPQAEEKYLGYLGLAAKATTIARKPKPALKRSTTRKKPAAKKKVKVTKKKTKSRKKAPKRKTTKKTVAKKKTTKKTSKKKAKKRR
jgi:hypothetical protein